MNLCKVKFTSVGVAEVAIGDDLQAAIDQGTQYARKHLLRDLLH